MVVKSWRRGIKFLYQTFVNIARRGQKSMATQTGMFMPKSTQIIGLQEPTAAIENQWSLVARGKRTEDRNIPVLGYLGHWFQIWHHKWPQRSFGGCYGLRAPKMAVWGIMQGCLCYWLQTTHHITPLRPLRFGDHHALRGPRNGC